MKEIKTPDELVVIMKKNGIKFDIVNETEAKEFLANHNYYFKISAYRKNYEKKTFPDGSKKYISLDFAYLKELSTIDMYLRYLIIKICLDIEHFLKVNLMEHIENNPKEDGYNITKVFFIKYNNIWPNIKKHRTSSYCRDLIEKYYDKDVPIWVLLELISFGNLVHLFKLYDNTYKNSFRKYQLLFNVRTLRNAAAHSNCLINHLYKGGTRPSGTIRQFAKDNSNFGKTMINTKLSNQVIHDFIVMLYVFDDAVKSEKVKMSRYKELNDLFKGRMLKNKEYFTNHEAIKTSYKFCSKILDKLYLKAYNDNIN